MCQCASRSPLGAMQPLPEALNYSSFVSCRSPHGAVFHITRLGNIVRGWVSTAFLGNLSVSQSPFFIQNTFRSSNSRDLSNLKGSYDYPHFRDEKPRTREAVKDTPNPVFFQAHRTAF